MARNRKNQSAAVRFGPAVKALLLCLFIGGSGVGYVWQKNQIHVLATEIKKREERLGQLRQKNKQRSDQLTIACSPQSLEGRIRQMNLGLVLPPPTQIIRLSEMPVAAPAAGVSPGGMPQYAGVAGGSVRAE